MMMTIPVITIDGPSGSGKGATAEALAGQLSWNLLDSGMIYRSVTWVLLQHNNFQEILNNNDQLKSFLKNLDLKIEKNKSYYKDQDISDLVREEHIGIQTSTVASYPLVRDMLLEMQRQQALLPGLIADGRDMGTVVFPDARLKIFLTASVENRANRRYSQLISKNIKADLSVIKNDIIKRDEQDYNRQYSPLKKAEDAIEINNDNLNLEDVIQKVINIRNEINEKSI